MKLISKKPSSKTVIEGILSYDAFVGKIYGKAVNVTGVKTEKIINKINVKIKKFISNIPENKVINNCYNNERK